MTTLAEPPLRLLLVVAQASERVRLSGLLARTGLELRVTEVESIAAGAVALRESEYECAMVDQRLPDGLATELLERARAAGGLEPPLIVLANRSESTAAPSALRHGADDVVFKDRLDPQACRRSIRQARERHRIRMELEQANARLERLAAADPLTGVFNRLGLERLLSREAPGAGRDGTQVFALLIDLDDFKRINDQHGHSTGDAVLQSVAGAIQRSLRARDHVARVGGDEFIVILPETRPAEALAIAERIRSTLARQRHSTSAGPVQVTASIGVSTVPEAGPSVTELLVETQEALHRCKQRGKNRIAVSGAAGVGELEADETRRLDLAHRLCHDDVFDVFVQPIVRLADGRTAARELFTRGPSGLFRMPLDFFRFCREHNILRRVDLRCFGRCVSVGGVAGGGEDAPPAALHVNLFPSTLLEVPVGELLALLPASYVRGSLCVELSAQYLFGNPAALRQPVAALREAGVRIALDDVGFGRTPLESVLLLEPEVVKVHSDWIRGLDRAPEKVAALRRLRSGASALGASLCAEGVETRQEADALREAGLELGQGQLFGEPKLLAGAAGGGAVSEGG